jgi:hypothetical protein
MGKANKALAIASQLAASREQKFLVTSVTVSADNVGDIAILNSPTQGLSDSQRVGDRIWLSRFRFELWRVIPGTATGRFSLRFLIILDRQNTIQNMDQIFFTSSTSQAPFYQFVKDYRKQFVVLYDSGANHMDQYNKGDTLRCNRKVNIRTQFVASTATIATGALKLVYISNQNDNSNSKPILIGSLRVDYTDA